MRRSGGATLFKEAARRYNKSIMHKPGEDMEAAEKRRFCFSWQTAVILLTLAIIGAVVGYAVARLSDNRVARGVRMAGLRIGGLTKKEAEDLLHVRGEVWGQTSLTLVFSDRVWVVTPSSIGLRPDYQVSVSRAMRIGRHGGPLARLRERRRVSREGLDLAPSFRLRHTPWEAFCRTVETEINQEPVNARLAVDVAGRLSTTPGRDGRRLDRAALLAALQTGFAVRERTVYTLPVVKARPVLSEQEIRDWPLDQVLAFYTTKFTAADESRTHNLAMAAAALDGLIIEAGRDFSFNKHVGPRVPEKGYMEAPVVFQNRLVLGMGGGVCQVSGTLFNAALLANLPIVNHTNHSLPSSYLPLGRDATVVYGAVDLVFTNDTGRPIYLAAGVYGSRLVVALIGHRDVRPQVRLEVEIKEKIPFEIVEENDPGLAAGTEAVTQKGRYGYKTQLWRVVARPDGGVDRQKIGRVAYYPPIKEIIKHGVGSPRFGNLMPRLNQTETVPAANETQAAPTVVGP